MSDQITYYVAHGDVRGTCIHKHRTAHTAALCAKRDGSRCARLPGGNSYSDRDVWAVYADSRARFVDFPK